MLISLEMQAYESKNIYKHINQAPIPVLINGATKWAGKWSQASPGKGYGFIRATTQPWILSRKDVVVQQAYALEIPMTRMGTDVGFKLRQKDRRARRFYASAEVPACLLSGRRSPTVDPPVVGTTGLSPTQFHDLTEFATKPYWLFLIIPTFNWDGII